MKFQKKASTQIVTFFTLVVTLLPFMVYLSTGIEAIAETTTENTEIFQNENGRAKISYKEDMNKRNLDWTVEYTKNASDLARQLGFVVKADAKTILPETITSEPAGVFSLGEDAEKQPVLLQTKATKENDRGKIFFKTARVTSLSIQVLENEFQTDGSQKNILAMQEPVKISIPQNAAQISSSPESTNNSFAETTQTTNITTSEVANSTQTSINPSSSPASTASESKEPAMKNSFNHAVLDQEFLQAESGRDITTLPGASSLTSSSDGPTILDSAKITGSDGKEISGDKLVIGTDVRLTYAWSIPDKIAKNVREGDFYQFKLPTNFKVITTLTGDLSDGPTVYGHYTFSTDGTAKIVFTDQVAKHSNISGSVYVSGKVDNSVNGTDNQFKIPFTGKDESKLPPLTIPNSDALAKAVDNSNALTSKDIIDDQADIVWTLKVNRTNEIMPKGSYVQDKLPNADFSFSKVLSVAAFDLDPNTGSFDPNKGTDATNDVSIEDNGSQVTFNKDTRKYYEIKVLTHINNVSKYAALTKDKNPTVSFLNTADLYEQGKKVDTATSSIDFGNKSSLSKEGTQLENGLIKWTVKVTHTGFDTPAGTVFKDIMNNGQVMTDSSGKERSKGILNTDAPNLTLTIKQNSTGNYDLITNNPIKEDFTIVYYSKAPDAAIGDFDNKITWNGVTSDKNITGKNDGSGIVKGFAQDNPPLDTTNDPAKKIQKWSITINNKAKAITSWWVQDKLDPGLFMDTADFSTIKVYQGAATEPLDTKLYTIQDRSSQGFRIDYNGKKATTDSFRIEYTAHYDGTIHGKDLINRAAYHYTFDGTNYEEDSSKNLHLPPLIKPTMGGSKAGSLNKVNNSIDWTITINSQKNPKAPSSFGNQAQIVDPIPDGITYQAGSLKVLKNGVLDNSATIKATYDEEKHIVTFSGFEAGDTSTYQLIFTTNIDTKESVLADGTKVTIIPQGDITNTATYSDDKNQPPTLTAKVEYNKTGDVISKNGAVNTDGKSIHFNVKINPDTKNNPVTNKLSLEGVHVSDILSDALKLQASTVKLTYNDGTIVPTDRYSIEEGVRSMDILFKNKVEQQINLSYDADVLIPDKPGATINVYNVVTINGTNVQTNSANKSLNVKVPNSGGHAQGVVGTITLKKTGDSGAVIKGAAFSLYSVDTIDGKATKTLYTKDVTDSKGEIHFTGLPYGKYILNETKAAEGYYIDSEAGADHEITIGKAADNLKPDETITVTNKETGSIKLTKADAEDSAIKLAGAKFRLYQNDVQVTKNALGNPIDTFTTDATGTVLIQSLVPGDYILKEVGTPTGYHVSTTDTAVTVNPGEMKKVIIKNTINHGRINFQKNSNGQPLAGAVFTLTSDKNDPTEEALTDKDGKIGFELKANRTYTITETKNPVGYQGSYSLTGIKVTDEGKAVYTDADGHEQTVTDSPIPVSNERITTSLEGTKFWDFKGNDSSNLLPEKIKLTLVQTDHTGKAVDYATQEISPVAGKWHYSFTNLPKYDLAASTKTEYHYTVKEAVAGYEAVYTKQDDTHMDIQNTLQTTSLSGKKTWDGLAEKYGLVPDKITVNLMVSNDNGTTWMPFTRNGKAVTAESAKTSDWMYHFNDLPKFDKTGKALTYQVQEIPINGYKATLDGPNLKNTLEKTKISVEKHWNDEKNHFATRPDDLVATLMVKQGSEWKTFKEVFNEEKTVTLTDSNDWKDTFTALPKYDKNQQLIQYGVKEDITPMQPTYSQNNSEEILSVDQESTANLINNLNTVSLSIDKKWTDFDNKFQTRPDQITFQLYAWSKKAALAEKIGTSDNETGEFLIKADSNHQYQPITIAGLPKYDKSGAEMHYKVVETHIQENYKQTPNYTAKDHSLSIENILDTTDITITKQWDERGNQAFERPAVTLQLFRQVDGSDSEAMPGDEYTQTISPNSKEDTWSYTFKNLPAKDNAGKTYNYSVKETSTEENYQASQVDPLTVKNTLITKQVRVRKQWKDFNNKFQTRPDEITFNLMYKKDGQDVAFTNTSNQAVTKTIKVSRGSDWTYTFDQLPAKDLQGNEYIYDVREVLKRDAKVLTPNYISENIGSTMVNTLKTIAVQGKKNWDDFNNKFNTRPTSIKLQLQQNGQAMKDDEFTKEIQVGEDGTWSYEFKDLPEVDNTGEKYTYTVKELDVPKNYETAEDGMNITNKLLTTSVAGKKTWNDFNNKFNTRPASIKVQLLQDGQALPEADFIKEVRKASEWSYQFKDLPKYAADGHEYLYSVKELSVPIAYTVTENGLNLTNQLVTTEIAGEKIWLDHHDQDKLRPKTITVALLQNGHQIAKETVSAKEDWQYQFSDLAKFDRNGKQYDYRVKELNVPKGYEASVIGHQIINRHSPKPPIEKLPKDKRPENKIIKAKTTSPKTKFHLFPKTNDQNQPIWLVIGVLISLFSGIFWYRRKK